MLGGPKELSNAQVQRLYEIRRKFGLKGKHPADLCPNLAAGKPKCPNCEGACSDEPVAKEDDVIAEITKRVLAQLGK